MIEVYGDDGVVKSIDGFTADQMRGYAIDAMLAARGLAEKPGMWLIRYPDGVVIPLVGETVPDCYAKFATPYYAKEKSHDAN